MKARSQDDYVRTALRVPPDLHARLHEAAKGSGRTFNAEILSRLEQSFELGDGPDKEIHLSREQLNRIVQAVADQVAVHLAGAPEIVGRTPSNSRKGKE